MNTLTIEQKTALLTLLGEYDPKYNASLNRGACMRDTAMPCKICGWGPHMQIHSPANLNVKGYGHAYSPNDQAQRIGADAGK